MGPIVWDEDVHVVGGPVSRQAGAEIAAKRVVTGGVLSTNLTGSNLTLILIWKPTNKKKTYSSTKNEHNPTGLASFKDPL